MPEFLNNVLRSPHLSGESQIMLRRLQLIANHFQGKRTIMTAIDNSFNMNHTCLRIKDPKASIAFYEKSFGMKLLDHLESDGHTLYLVGFSNSSASNWAARSGVLALHHEHGAEKDANYEINNGNGEKFRGFGHTCVSVDNIVECEKNLLADGVQFKKKLSDGRQKNIAFVLDPDGYWIELVEHKDGKQEGKTDRATYRLNHQMIRVKDPSVSLDFYRGVLGMKLFTKLDFADAKFSLYFVGYEHDPSFEDGKMPYEKVALREGVIEFTHNWGTEKDDSFEGYHNGNSTENGASQGFSHFCVSCKSPAKLASEIDQSLGVNADWATKWDGVQKGSWACIRDPDGYYVKIIGDGA